MTIKTAICKDSRGNIVPVQCKVWSNGQTTCLRRTKDQLRKDHPNLTFEAWVRDLSDTNAINLAFLSPNVDRIKVWADYSGAIRQVWIDRAHNVIPA